MTPMTGGGGETWGTEKARLNDEVETLSAQLRTAREALENLCGDVYLYSLAGESDDGHEIPWAAVMRTQAEGIKALTHLEGGNPPPAAVKIPWKKFDDSSMEL